MSENESESEGESESESKCVHEGDNLSRVLQQTERRSQTERQWLTQSRQ